MIAQTTASDGCPARWLALGRSMAAVLPLNTCGSIGFATTSSHDSTASRRSENLAGEH
jgi:hypothetical protein